LKTIVFYHSADFDGMCSGAIIKYFYPEVVLVGVDYGQQFPWDRVDAGDEVYMVDFSLPMVDMINMEAITSNFVWIDHHKSAIEEAAKYNWLPGPSTSGYNVLDTDYSGCELTWKYLEGWGTKLPLAVFWLGRYDIWKQHENPGSLEFQYGLRLYDGNPENQQLWKRLFTDNSYVNTVREQGKTIIAYESRQAEIYLKVMFFLTTFEGLRCLAVNKGMCNSLTFNSLWDQNKYDAMLAFSWKKDKWSISIYTDHKNLDLSKVCKKYGGGGHPQAAGFVCDVLPFKLQGEINEIL
jgi:uncharacterized protein